MTELVLFFLLIIKHAIIDLGLQAHLLWGRSGEKYHYFGAAGHWHYLHHAIGSFLVFLYFTDLHTTCVLSIIDYLAHWHIDFAKHRTNRYLKVTKSDIIWWWTTVADQLLHFLTYFLLMLYVISY